MPADLKCPQCKTTGTFQIDFMRYGTEQLQCKKCGIVKSETEFSLGGLDDMFGNLNTMAGGNPFKPKK